MRRITIIAWFILISIIVFSQNLRNYNYFSAPVKPGKISHSPSVFQAKSLESYTLEESFEGTFPPTGWTKANPDGGPGWNQQTVGTTPIPGWQGGTIDAPAGGGSKIAFCTWNTGGSSSNDQWLITSQVLINSGDELKFWVRKFGPYVDNLDVKLSTTNAQTASFTVTIANLTWTTTEGDAWTEYTYSLNTYIGQNVYIAFREHVADNYNDGAAILFDMVRIGTPPASDVGITAISSPSNETTCSLTASENVTVTVMNFGSAAATGFPVSYQVNGGTPVTETISASINAGATLDYTFTQSVNLSVYGGYEILAYTSMVGDATTFNDSYTVSVGSSDAYITVDLLTDAYPSESSWIIITQNNDMVHK
ncbi:MAG: choice-of-anchor J domain-containing protein [Bacteroidia bacterium]|nr:choice-of-anchor J domain-containing protein [Bacteroidia bacterium]